MANRPAVTDPGILRSLAGGAAVGFAGLLVGRLFQYGFTVAVARSVGPGAAGLVFEAVALATLLATVSRLGLDRLGMRTVSRGLHEGLDVRGLAGRVLLPSGLAAIVLGTAVWFGADPVAALFGQPGEGASYRWFGLVVPGLSVSLTLSLLFRGMRRPGLEALFQLIIVFGLPTTFLLASSSLAPHHVALALGASSILSICIGLPVWHRLSGSAAGAAGGAPALPWSRAPFFLWISLLAFAFNGMDVILLGILGTETETAYYVAGARTAMVLGLGLLAVNMILAPTVAVHYQQRRIPDLQSTVRVAARWSLASAAAAGGVAIVGHDLVLGWFGADYRAATVTLWILVIGQVANAATGGVSVVLQMADQESRAARILTVTIALAIPLYVAGISTFGLIGAATVTTLAQVGWNAAMAVAARRRIGVTCLSDTLGRAAGFLLASVAVAVAGKRAGLAQGAVLAGYVALAAPFWWLLLLKREDRATAREMAVALRNRL